MSKELKTQLIQQCKDTVGNDLDGRRPLNIAVGIQISILGILRKYNNYFLITF
jgi:hypothetical protein